MDFAISISGFVAIYVFILAAFAGWVIIGHVPAILHTPLMSGSNFVHGIVVVGGIFALLNASTMLEQAIGFFAVLLGAGFLSAALGFRRAASTTRARRVLRASLIYLPSLLLLLLQLQLPLLHLLQHLLRCLHTGLIRRGGLLFRLSGRLIRCGIVCAIVGTRGIRVSCTFWQGRSRVSRVLNASGLRLLRHGCAIGIAAPIVRLPCFCHQDHARQHVVIGRRT